MMNKTRFNKGNRRTILYYILYLSRNRTCIQKNLGGKSIYNKRISKKNGNNGKTEIFKKIKIKNVKEEQNYDSSETYQGD